VKVVKRAREERMRLLTVHLPEAYIQGLDELVKMGLYPNRSEAIRVAVRDLLSRELWRNRSGGGFMLG